MSCDFACDIAYIYIYIHIHTVYTYVNIYIYIYVDIGIDTHTRTVHIYSLNSIMDSMLPVRLATLLLGFVQGSLNYKALPTLNISQFP